MQVSGRKLIAIFSLAIAASLALLITASRILGRGGQTPSSGAPITVTGTLTTGFAGGWIIVPKDGEPIDADVSAVRAAATALQLKPVIAHGHYADSHGKTVFIVTDLR